MDTTVMNVPFWLPAAAHLEIAAVSRSHRHPASVRGEVIDSRAIITRPPPATKRIRGNPKGRPFLGPRFVDDIERRLRRSPELTESGSGRHLAHPRFPGLRAQGEADLLVQRRRRAQHR